MLSDPVWQLAPRALPDTLLIHTWTEALHLWKLLVSAFPEALALCIMPNHVHLATTAADARRKMRSVMSAYARWRAHHRGVPSQACWQPLSPLAPVADEKHLEKAIRYIHLNPCRGDLASDPLRWPLSTHRDFIGMGLDFSKHDNPERFHRYVSSDKSVSLTGTDLPCKHRSSASFLAVQAAVSSVLRIEPTNIVRRNQSAKVLLRALDACEFGTPKQIALAVERSPSLVYSLLKPPEMPDIASDRALASVLRAVGDPRFRALTFPNGREAHKWGAWAQG